MVRKADTSRARAERGDSKSKRTRTRILDAAAHVLSVQGFSGLRLQDVAAYAQLQAPGIYYHFSSREALIEEVMFCGISSLRRHLLQALCDLPPQTPSMGKILVAVEAHLRHVLELSDYATASIRNAGQIPEHLRTRQKEEEAAYGRIWQQLFTTAAAGGEIRDDINPEMARFFVLGALNWAVEWWDPERDSIEAVVSTAQALVGKGLAPE
ncbi:TetR/AcrR family transcriptional regulator [Mycobacterium sp.]|uniref:TetR/AcrR family transcriptional regulator n=1 Tax=Mycobacterium sp. TaxID=1785 RepID=UPI003BAE7706